jgi:hypothetical protein
VADRRGGATTIATPLLLSLAVLVTLPAVARAEPNLSVAATIGGGISDFRHRERVSQLFHLGVRADLLLLRDRDSDMAVGPYVDFATGGFSTAEMGGGVEWLIPLTEHLPMILSTGGIARTNGADGLEPGIEGTVFVGSRSLNFHSIYGFGAGVFLQARIGVAGSLRSDAILGIHVDLALLSLPFVLAYNALAR